MNMINPSRLFVLTTLSLGMVACSTIPPKAQDVVAQPQLPLDEKTPYPDEVMSTQTLSTPEMPSVATVRWQEFYGDEKLKKLIEIGLNHNKDLQQAILAIESAKAQYQIKDNADIPTVGSSASGSLSQGADKTLRTGLNVGLAMSGYEIDLWGKIQSTKEVALHDYLAVNANKDALQISLIASIAQSYVDLSYALAQRQLAIETQKTRQHSLMIAQKRFGAGIDARTPSLQAEASLESAKSELLEADTKIIQLNNALQLLLGVPVPKELMPDMAVSNITTRSVLSAGLPSELLYYRPDIIKAEHELKGAGANINVARAAFFPSISLSTNLGYDSSSLKDLFSSGVFSWSLPVSANLPIFDAGARTANYELATIAQKNALVNYERAIQTAFKEVKDVLATRATLQQRLDTQYRLQRNFQETYKIAHARFRSGLDNYLGVLDAERSLFSNQMSILGLEQQKVLSQIQLYRVLGGGAVIGAEQVAEIHAQREAMKRASIVRAEEVVEEQKSAE